MKIYLALLLPVIISSCDFSTKKWISFEGEPTDRMPTSVYWGDEEDPNKDASFYTCDSVEYDHIRLYFYNDKSYEVSYLDGYYQDTTENNIQDSVKIKFYRFALEESDQKITDNDSVLAIFMKKKKVVQKSVLRKKKHTSTFTDRLPVIRIH